MVHLPPVLPQELVDIVTDYIQDDPLTLRTCSYVSPSFRRSSQRHVFSRIRFLPPRSAKRPTLCKTFYDILVSSPRLASHVKDLEVLEGDDCTETSPPWVASDESLGLVLPLLQLRRFLFHCPYPRLFVVPRTLQALFLDVFRSPTLRSLTLGRLIFTPSSLNFSGTNLKELVLLNVSVYSGFDTERADLDHDANSTQLESFTAIDSNEEVLRLLLGPQSPVDLRCLSTLSLSGNINLLHLEAFVQRPRRTLRHLKVQDSLATFTDFALDTAQHDNMRSLSLEARGSPSWINVFGNCSPRLERITLGLALIDFSAITQRDWTELDQVLTRPKMAHLRAVVIKVHPGYVGEEWTKITTSSFKQCADSARRHLPALSRVLELESIPDPSRQPFPADGWETDNGPVPYTNQSLLKGRGNA
ncbi:hypothetical protein B0H19DRAFT_1163113 [Mycena capillaripes]|nr:hypothetical protein B0H19DRAFT_1163113 [Mycena capillaripes]